MEPTRDYALSIKQPWATLVVHGLKTIEVRRWSTPRRGRVLIHAARIPDERPEGWNRLPEHLREAALLGGGILGAAEVVGCQHYRSLEEFCGDHAGHLNEPEWFETAGLFGFTFAKPEVLPFRKYPGWMRFFPVDPGPFRRKAKTPVP
jgi:hypothetical protein